MFKIQSLVLKDVVGSLAKGARKARLGENYIFIRTLEDGHVSFLFTGEDTSVERKVQADIQGKLEIATTMREMDVKVAALPNDEEILFQLSGNVIQLKWGKKSTISVNTVPETTPRLEIPELVEQVKWGAGMVHGISRVLTPFTASPNSQRSQQNPSIGGPNFLMEPDTGEVLVRATDGFRGVTMRAANIQWFSKSVSIDSNTLLGVADVLPKEAEITVGMNEEASLIVFSSGSTTAVVRTLIGQFPGIEKLYRTSAKSKWKFDRLDLIELCKRVKLLSPQKPVLEFRIKDQKVIAVVPGSLEQHVGVAIEGVASEFAINASYLEMTASLFRTEEVDLLVEAGNQAITVKIDGNDDIRSLLSPIRLQ